LNFHGKKTRPFSSVVCDTIMHRLYSSRRYKPKGVHRGDVTITERERERESECERTETESAEFDRNKTDEQSTQKRKNKKMKKSERDTRGLF